MSAVDEVRATSDRFYAALNAMTGGDPASFDDVWSHDDSVTVLQPMGGRADGWEAVRESFAGVAGVASSGNVEIVDRTIVAGTDLAYETGTERGWAVLAGERVTLEHRVTNVYRLEDGQWRMIHHHTDVSPAILAVVERLQAA
jgi:ketosteroid isomerase-like protein